MHCLCYLINYLTLLNLVFLYRSFCMLGSSARTTGHSSWLADPTPTRSSCLTERIRTRRFARSPNSVEKYIRSTFLMAATSLPFLAEMGMLDYFR